MGVGEARMFPLLESYRTTHLFLHHFKPLFCISWKENKWRRCIF